MVNEFLPKIRDFSGMDPGDWTRKGQSGRKVPEGQKRRGFAGCERNVPKKKKAGSEGPGFRVDRFSSAVGYCCLRASER